MKNSLAYDVKDQEEHKSNASDNTNIRDRWDCDDKRLKTNASWNNDASNDKSRWPITGWRSQYSS